MNLILYALTHHSKAERDELVLGRPLDAEEMNVLWPRPWLYLRTLLLFVVGLVLLYFCWKNEQRFESSHLLPGLTVVGALALPVTLLIFFWEINKWRSLTLLDVLSYFLIGSCLAITITFLLDMALDMFVPDQRWYYNGRNYFTPRKVLNEGFVPLIVTAFVEELGKAVAILAIMMSHRKSCHVLHGILVGAAVGAGFAVFESAGYIYMDLDNLLSAIMIRSFTATCHVAWGALMGGAFAMAAGGRFRFRVLRHPLSTGAFVLVCVLHFAWNYLNYLFTTINQSIELGVVTWFLLLLMIWHGLHEIGRAQRR